MLSYVRGNLFTSPAHVLVNTINTVGAMGKGIAKTFKSLYPEMFAKYQKLCEVKEIEIGKLWLYKTPNKWILNFPTKQSWKSPSKPEYIEAGLKAFVENYAGLGITSIAFPPLGCGNGDLDWEKQVRPLMEKYLKELPIDIFIYLYSKSEFDKPEHLDIQSIKKWLRSEPRSLSFDEVWEDLKEVIKRRPSICSKLKAENVSYKLTQILDSISDEETEAIFIECEHGQNTIGYYEWQEIWGIIRNYGFISKKLMPFDYDKIYDEIISLLLELAYCQEAIVSKKYNELNDSEIGIQINETEIPNSSPQQFKLLFNES